ncbi:uncharacterized protein [Physcomitrium patens]|uniref:Uncharacterized protein n=1 Tax=Physcomitrium patens TaxID=3218 RepID=A0A2K1LBS3_PHYPA|nr:uncharacterized protein LOC112288922 isoform X2 [Physcomitrium patens]XP_024389490.1 uncharacterized protein LOC112288922 isoform X2 [Physcomitrium patens]PNR63479.1 hypothetical protein PHYPA_001905 [Physcomitrium patens]|eukprot:XP_024389480.1 uncharacterized protein LOC112288922 isoform X2 [Physcomitrella patens]
MKTLVDMDGWEQERRAAKRVFEYLEHDIKQQDEKRRWILRNWPEPRGRGDKQFRTSSMECVPELLLREKEELSLRSLNAFVGRSLSILLKNKMLRKRTVKKKRRIGDALMRLDSSSMKVQQDLLRITDGADVIPSNPLRIEEGLLTITHGGNQANATVARKEKEVFHSNQKPRSSQLSLHLEKMDDMEVLTSLPCVLDTLNLHALQSILSIITGVTTRNFNRIWLEDQIVQTVNDLMNECEDELPDVVMQAIEVMRDEISARRRMSSGILFELPPSPILAIQSALDQVESLPLRTLHAMYDLINERPVEKVRLAQSLTGGNRERLARSLRATTEYLTDNLEEGDPLPEPLKKALHAMSLSAKELDGNDGNLLSIVGPPPPDVEAVHNRLLLALSQLKKLGFHSLISLSSVVHEGPAQSFCKLHPAYLRSHFRRILLDFLLRCDVPEVPALIQKIIDVIAAEDGQPTIPPEKSKKYLKKPKKPDRISKRSMWQQGERNSDEVEAVLQISSHLVQIVREKEEAEEQTASMLMKIEKDSEAPGVQNTDSRDEDESHRLDDVAVRTAADEAGSLCYSILGRGLEELLPPEAAPLPYYVQKYLQGGSSPIVRQVGENDEEKSAIDEVDLLMKIAESLPGVSTRALQNMRTRLALV